MSNFDDITLAMFVNTMKGMVLDYTGWVKLSQQVTPPWVQGVQCALAGLRALHHWFAARDSVSLTGRGTARFRMSSP